MGFMAGTFSAPGGGWNASGTQIAQPSTVAQANTAYGQAQQGIGQQQGLVGQTAPGGAQGFANQSALAGQLSNQAQGQGPNPAQAALNAATGQNIASQGALMAGQRGAGSNPALIARQAAMQGANTQQQAVGQSATMQAQQQLAAQHQLANLSAQQVGQQANAVSGFNQAAQSEQGNLLGSIGAQNNANVGMQSNINSTNAGIQGINAQGQQALTGGILGAAGGALKGLAGFAEGGVVPETGPTTSFGKYFNQDTQGQSPSSLAGTTNMPQGTGALYQGSKDAGSGMMSLLGKIAPMAVETMSEGGKLGTRAMSKSGEQTSSGVSTNYGSYAKGGKVKAMLSPGEIYLPPKKAKAVAAGKMSPMVGEKISGNARVAGDSLKNDTVPKTLESGGVVVKRSQANDPEKARSFVQAVMAHSMAPKKRK